MTEPLALLALLSLPAIVALHLFRRATQQRVVSALFLWEEPEQIARAGRRREPLRRSVSLLLELLAAACLALALAGPRGCAGEAPRHLVAVLDDTASMSARAAGTSAADRARAELQRVLDDCEPDAQVTLIVSGEPPRVLAGPRASLDAARAALATYAPTAAHHPLGPAIALARAGWRDAELLVLSDHVADLGDELELRAVGSAQENWALVAARREPLASAATHERLTLELASFATSTAELIVTVAAVPSERVLVRRAIPLEAGRSVTLALDVELGAGDLRVVLQSPRDDALALDDAVDLPAPRSREVHLHLAAPEEDLRALRLVREGGARCDPRGLGAAEAWAASVAASELHLGRAPAPEEARAALVWSAPGTEVVAFASPFLVERAHPLLRGVELEGIVWAADPLWRPPGRALVRAGEVVLLSEERRAGRRIVHLNLAPARSTLGSSPDWPVLLANAIDARRAELSGPRESLVAVGRAPRAVGTPLARYELRELATDLRLELRASDDGTLALPALPRTGRYELAALDALDASDPSAASDASTGPRWTIAAALLDERESDLRSAARATRGTLVRRTRGEDASSRTVSGALAALFVAFLVLDWLWIARGFRRAPRASGAAPLGAAR